MKLNVLEPVRNALKSIINGTIFISLGVNRLFPYILYAFLLGWLSIWMSYKMEQTMAIAEDKEKELEAMRIYHAQKTCEYEGFDRISTVEMMLEVKGSEVKAPERPADVLKK